ncbi:MAG: hypothetical protein U0361_03425 [Nitrospiraceae bacterium]
MRSGKYVFGFDLLIAADKPNGHHHLEYRSHVRRRLEGPHQPSVHRKMTAKDIRRPKVSLPTPAHLNIERAQRHDDRLHGSPKTTRKSGPTDQLLRIYVWITRICSG